MTGRQRFESTLVEQCAHTLAGIKPGSLFRITGDTLQELRQAVDTWDRQLAGAGIRVIILKECPVSKACMIYLYRPGWLRGILRSRDIQTFLQREGYRVTDEMGMLAQLSRRLCVEERYPHEIGVFLGYPLEDVVGFIENRGWNYTCCGYWKVYGDPEPAKRRFEGYRACTERCKRCYAEGVSITELVSA